MQLAEALVKAGANLDSQDENGRSPLHWAVKAKSKECTALLISSKCKLDLPDKDGNTPFHVAVERDAIEIIPMLAAANASWVSQNKKGVTPMHTIVDKACWMYLERLSSTSVLLRVILSALKLYYMRTL